jgi:hypothetical protein
MRCSRMHGIGDGEKGQIYLSDSDFAAAQLGVPDSHATRSMAFDSELRPGTPPIWAHLHDKQSV